MRSSWMNTVIKRLVVALQIRDLATGRQDSSNYI
jgi:hypothetical protein